MKKSFVEGLFPTPVYINNIDRNFTEQELQFVNDQQNNCIKNEGNIHTEDSYVLDRKQFKNIKIFLENCCKDYLEKIICPENNIELYITQSWLNYTKENQYHHKHLHSNSIISGVLYFNCNKDSIKFYNSNINHTIKPLIKKYNFWNSETWTFPAKTGELFMFPSSLNHGVDVKKGDNIRISLSFNTFYRGVLGSDTALTKLIL
jgi:uncharacterized protein (TIGR02466 family)|tara:strand:- start:1048 stop:1659 length:612 start_codon:yes stop_codon:yes gene_type:complete